MARDHQMDAWVQAIARQRDKAAFGALFGRIAPQIKGFLMRGGASATQADEITQEVMLTVWRRADSFDPRRASASTWIFTIARNKRIDSLRRRRPEVDLEDPVVVLSAPARQDQEVAATEREQRVRAALAELPPAQADILRAAYFEHKSLRAIAEEMGLPTGTVKSRVRLAFKRLRATIPDMEDSL